MCILPLGENGLEKYRLSKKWEQFKIVLLFMDHPVLQIGIHIAHPGKLDGTLNSFEHQLTKLHPWVGTRTYFKYLIDAYNLKMSSNFVS